MRNSHLSGAAVAAVLAGSAVAQCWDPVRVRENDCLAGDRAGSAVGIDGDWMITGTTLDDGQGADSGAAHVFVREPNGHWKQQDKLQSQAGGPGQHAGSGVAIAGDQAFVGMPYGGLNGYVCQYKRTGEQWKEMKLLVSGINEENARFGSAVAASDYWMLAGGPNGLGNHGNSGAVSVFKHAGVDYWSLYQRCSQTDSAPGDEFGAAVAMNGKDGAAGAPKWSGQGKSHCGSVTMFPDGAFGKQFWAPDPESNAHFGAALAIGEGLIVVGAPDATVNGGGQAGAVYVYALNGSNPVFQQKLTNGAGHPYHRFGAAIAVAGGHIFAAEAASGEVIRFDLDQNADWQASGTIVDPDQPEEGHFGGSLATDGARLVVGDDYDDYVELSFADSGAAYIVDLPSACPADTDGNGLLDLFDFLGFQNLFAAQDCRADMSGDGVYNFFDFLAYQNAFSAGCE